MPINVNTFVWIHEPTPGAEPEKITTNKPIAEDFVVPKTLTEDSANAEYIPLSEDGSLKVKRSQYTEDMMSTEPEKSINTVTDNKKE